jgi:hypothetical protein
MFMKRMFRDLFSRAARAGLFIILGTVLCWRALNYPSPRDTSMLAPLMCVFLAFALAMTGVALAMRGNDLDQPAPQPSPGVPGEGAIAAYRERE